MAFASSCLVTDVLNFEKIIVEVLKRTGCRKFARRFYGSQPNIKCLITPYFAAKISIGSILGAAASNSAAFSINAFAILPPRCASLPSSSEEVSKMPNVEASIRNAYHVIVPASSLASGNALVINSSTQTYLLRLYFLILLLGCSYISQWLFA